MNTFRQENARTNTFIFIVLCYQSYLAVTLRIIKRRSDMLHADKLSKLLKVFADEPRTVIRNNPRPNPWKYL